MDLGLADRVYLVTGASRGLAGPWPTCSSPTLPGWWCPAGPGVGRPRGRCTGDRAWGWLPTTPHGTPDGWVAAARERGRLDGALMSVGGPPLGEVLEITDEQWPLRSTRSSWAPCGSPACWPASWGAARSRCPVDERPLAAAGPGGLQRPAARARDGRQDPGRRAGAGGVRVKAPRPRARSGPNGSPSSGHRLRSRWAATASRGIRPGRGLLALAGRVVRLRRDAARRRGALRAL